MSKTRFVTKIGIADCHGIESYKNIDEDNSDGILLIRVMANRQRHAVLYKVEVPEMIDRLIQRKIKKRDFIKALEILKDFNTGLGFPENAKESFKKSWELIPNPKLDPWR